jgi:hypothetical protein
MSEFRRRVRGVLWVMLLAPVALAQSMSSITLGSSTNPAVYGQPVTLTAIVTAGATGKVTFYDGVAVLGVSPVSGGQAVLTTILLPAGSSVLRAYYAAIPTTCRAGRRR